MNNFYQSDPIDTRLMTIARVIPHQIVLIKLSKTQLKVLNEIKRGQVTSEHIAKRCGLSPAWASTLLRRLKEKSYLNRRLNTTEGGGITYTYSKCY